MAGIETVAGAGTATVSGSSVTVGGLDRGHRHGLFGDDRRPVGVVGGGPWAAVSVQ